MITMKPILEQAVIDALAQERFSGELDGYVILDGPAYLGHVLYRVAGKVTEVLECGVEHDPLVDGAVRACAAAGENAGAEAFWVNTGDEKLKKWHDVFFKYTDGPLPNDKLFHTCK